MNNERKNVCDNMDLLLTEGEYLIRDKSKFKYQTKIVTEGKKGGVKRLVQNPSKNALALGHYTPNLTLSSVPRQGAMSEALKIRLNLPKLLYGENVSEVADEDLPYIINALQKTLFDMGVEVTTSTLATTQVVSVHYGKNIMMPDNISPSIILQEVAKSKVSLRYDASKSDYKNDGVAIRFHTNESEICLYDKGREYLAGCISNKRSVEQDIAYQSIDKQFFKDEQILRFEIRLNSKRKIRSVLNKIGKGGLELTFANLFDSDISRSINLLHWQEILASNHIYHLGQEDSNTLLKHFASQYKRMKALQLFGLSQALKCSSARELKWLFGKDNTTLRELFKIIEQTPKNKSWLDDVFAHITTAINQNLIFRKGKKDEK